MSSGVQYYYDRALPPLPPAEQRGLFFRLQRGDEAAQEHLVRCNLRLAISIAMEYGAVSMPFDDVIQEAMQGLLSAVRGFDPTRGFRFSTYATRSIRNSIAKALDAKMRLIRLASSYIRDRWEMQAKEDDLTATLHRQPTDGELAKALGRPQSHVARLRLHNDVPLYIDSTARSHEQPSARNRASMDKLPIVGERSALDALIAEESIALVLSTLTNREREVVCLRFGLLGRSAHTNAAIGRSLGISRERVRQVLTGALRRAAEAASQRPKGH
jgi:RNA polymerase primary sigma factor